MDSLISKRILITGGAGFLGSSVVHELRRVGCKHLLVFRSAEYDLRNPAETVRLFSDTRPQIVIHLAAVVGGIGANRANPGRFFYDNLMMDGAVCCEPVSGFPSWTHSDVLVLIKDQRRAPLSRIRPSGCTYGVVANSRRMRTGRVQAQRS
jgi:hypothetical protein